MPQQIQELDRLAAARRADLRELCAEFQSAISAMTADDLQSLRNSIEKQERLAARLQSSLQDGELPQYGPAIAKEALELIHVTRVYSALLQSSMRTAALRKALCLTYKQQFAKSVAVTSSASWSCEV